MLQDRLARSRGVKFNVKKIIITLLIAIFALRSTYIIVSKQFHNSNLYIDMLNKGMPYLNSLDLPSKDNGNLTLQNYLASILGIEDINFFTVVKNEIPYFKELPNNMEYDENTIATLDPFELNDKSIIKYTPEEMPKEGTNIVSKAYDPKLKKTLNIDKPEVLIYHSHTMESYSPATAESNDPNMSVVGVGNALTKELEENYGIATIHDTTIHSLSYDDSYKRSGETLSKYLKKYNSFKIIIDLHRDAMENKTPVTATINGESVARIMFVLAQNNQYYPKNKALTDKLNTLSRNIFPGLSRGIDEYRRGKDSFNQNQSPNAILIEVGANCNSNVEAQNTAKYIARLLAEDINGK
ncbi:stage II sporulation protein P [Clostridium paridis]|uniref:Stage II sporulation protein P n=1 Tax=Clostridium paridis TaxID=2803863 RepID=A0A937FH97_9CLOT|nr:stage II sporulation protein P [Clostridium paridis]MBL4932980.1 stage II sporulation protein P [Clostridium paridis]